MSSIALLQDIVRSKAFAVAIRTDDDMTLLPVHALAKSWMDSEDPLPEFVEMKRFISVSDEFIESIKQLTNENGILDFSDNDVKSVVEKALKMENTFSQRVFSENFSGNVGSTRRANRRARLLSMKKEDSEGDAQKREALKVAAMIGCRGVHKNSKGQWVPCSSEATLNRISNSAESDSFLKKKGYEVEDSMPKRKRIRSRRKRRRDGWERLGSRGVMGIDSIDAGIVSAPVSSGVAGKSALMGPEYVRENDPDVFLDPESARARSRQLGCIGISRRVSKTGRAVWMPCTNMSDYARRSGSTALGRRGRVTDATREIRKLVRQEVSQLLKKKQ